MKGGRGYNGTKTGTQTEAITQAQRKNYIQYVHTTTGEGVYTNTLRVVDGIRHEKRYIDIGNYIGTVKQLHTICTYNNKREGVKNTGYMEKHIWQHKKPHTLPQRIARRKPLTEEAPPDHSGRLHQGPRSYKIGKDGRTCSEVVGEKRVS